MAQATSSTVWRDHTTNAAVPVYCVSTTKAAGGNASNARAPVEAGPACAFAAVAGAPKASRMNGTATKENSESVRCAFVAGVSCSARACHKERSEADDPVGCERAEARGCGRQRAVHCWSQETACTEKGVDAVEVRARAVAVLLRDERVRRDANLRSNAAQRRRRKPGVSAGLPTAWYTAAAKEYTKMRWNKVLTVGMAAKEALMNSRPPGIRYACAA